MSALICLGLFLSFSGLADTLSVIRSIPHTGYSEGLDFYQGYLWHALPKEILKIDPKDGTVVERHKPATVYSESIKWVNGKLWNVSYDDNGIYEGVFKNRVLSFLRKGSVPEIHAWGLEYDGRHFVVTGDYSHKLFFLHPERLTLVRQITTPISDLEDLAWDGTGLWTSSFTAHRGIIFRIDPKTGELTRFFSLPNPEECPIIDGIAFDGKTLWITGKNCPSIYQVTRPSERLLSSQISDKKEGAAPQAPQK